MDKDERRKRKKKHAFGTIGLLSSSTTHNDIAQEHIIIDRLRPSAMTENLCGPHIQQTRYMLHVHCTSYWRETKHSAASSHIHSASTQAYNLAENDIIIFFLRCFSMTGGTISPNNLVAVCDAKQLWGTHSILSLVFSSHEIPIHIFFFFVFRIKIECACVHPHETPFVHNVFDAIIIVDCKLKFKNLFIH